MFEVTTPYVDVLTQIFRRFGVFLKDISWIQTTEILLTAALVVLYRQQKGILRSGESSEVQIEGYRGGEKEWGSSANSIQVKLSNIGGGIATDFEVTFETKYEGDQPSLETTRVLSRNTGGQKEWIRGSGDYLESGERDEVFHSLLMIGWHDSDTGGEHRTTVPRCLEGLADEGVDEFDLSAWLHYTDQLGERHEEFLFHYTNIPTDEDIETVNELFLHGQNPRSPDVHDYVLPPGKKLGGDGFEEIPEDNN